MEKLYIRFEYCLGCTLSITDGENGKQQFWEFVDYSMGYFADSPLHQSLHFALSHLVDSLRDGLDQSLGGIGVQLDVAALRFVAGIPGY